MHLRASTLFLATLSLGSSPALGAQGDADYAGELAKLLPVGPPGSFVQPDAYFGYGVAIDGDVIAISAAWENLPGFDQVDAGAVYVYRRNDAGTSQIVSDDTWSLEQRIENPLPASADYFGFSIALEADTLVVGCHGDDTTQGANSGSVFVFVRNNGNWELLQRLVPPTLAAGVNFGVDVALDGTSIIVGAYLDDLPAGAVDAGSAYVFRRDDNGTPLILTDDAFPQEALLTNGLEASTSDQFGVSVDVDGSRAVVGACLDDSAHADQGSASVFVRSASGVWSLQWYMTAPNAEADDQFGRSVGIDGSVVAISAILDDSPATDAGSFYVFEPLPPLYTSWFNSEYVTLPIPQQAGAQFGFDIDVRGSRIVVGSHNENLGTSLAPGTARIYDRSTGSFSSLERLICHDGADYEYFGSGLALDGDTLVIGAHYQDVLGVVDTGAAYVFSLHTSERFETYCYGDGATGSTSCPCGNSSGGERKQGCRNSASRGAQLDGFGTAAVVVDDLQVVGWNFLPGAPALLFSGSSQAGGGAGVTFGDGLRCVGGPAVRRLGIGVPDANGRITWGPNLAAPGHWMPSDTRHFQAWYRNSIGSPCTVPSGYNLSSALTVTFR